MQATENEVIEQQWVQDMPMAIRVKKNLVGAAASQGLVIGIVPDGDNKTRGFFVTIERPARV
ncbi:MAG TPA: hypothetical protein VGG75_14055 [Trebonia sp.]|jgi:hypothetical protein